jgi:hypothetical protein
MRKILVFFALAIGASESTHGQQCESVIALSKVVSTVVADKESVEQHAANFCSEYSKSIGRSSNASFGASYKFLSATFGSNNASAEDVASKYCSTSNSSSASRDVYKQYIESISPNAYSAYEQCLIMSSQDLKFSVNLGSILPNEFSMSTSFISSIAGKTTALVTYSPSSGVTCNWDGTSEKSRTIQSGSRAILECRRTDQTKRAYVTLVRNDAGSGEPLTIPWQAYDKDGVPVDLLAAIQAKVTSLGSQLDGMRAELDASRIRPNVLATVIVQSGRLVSSSDGVSFDPSTGLISFSNPKNLPFVPVISDYSPNVSFITATHFVKEIVGTNQFRVRRKALDTGERTDIPISFTAIVVIF